MTKKIALLLSCILVFSSIQTVFANSSTRIIDTAPPVITDISINKDIVEVGSTSGSAIEIFAKATDDISGVKRISIQFRNEDYDSILYASFYHDYDYPQYDTYDEVTDTFISTVDISEYTLPGTYTIDRISVYDFADNGTIYSEYNNNLTFDTFFVVINDIVDITPPSISNISINKDVVEVPSNIKISAKATDDISGVKRISIQFRNEDYDSILYASFYRDYDYPQYDTYDEVTDTFISTIDISEYTLPGTYTVDRISVYDFADNGTIYSEYYNNLTFDTSFVVINDIVDITPPNISNISINKDVVEVPSNIEISAKATDDISGVKRISIQFRNEDYDSILYASFYRDYDYPQYDTYDEVTDTFISTIDISEYTLPGTYTVDRISVYDFADNGTIYSEYYNNLTFDTSFVVINDETIELTTNTKNPNIVNDIKNTEDGSKILIDYSSGSNVASDIFDAIKGTNKEIIFQHNGIQWVFNGQDITSAKNIDLNVRIKPISNYYSDNANEISNIVKDKPSVVIDFESNGELPGKALIRVKADYEFIQYLGSEDLYVYYYDKTTDSMVLIKENLNVTSDGFIEFEITHNSEYVVTNTFIDNLDIDDNDNGNNNTDTSSDNDDDNGSYSSSNSSNTSSKNTESNIKDNEVVTEVEENVEVAYNNHFNDIDNHWAKNSILYLTSNNILYGTSENTFEPNAYMTRAMFVTVLCRIIDADLSGMESTFDDTVKGSWYDSSVAFAYENNIINGVGDNKFAPNEPITREQMASIINNFSGVADVDLTSIKEKITFSDDEEISAWAKESVYTMQMAGVMNGRPNNVFDPKAKATRAESSVVLEYIFRNIHND